MRTITRSTLRADGLTVGEAMDNDAAFLRSVGIPVLDGSPTPDERAEEEHDARQQALRDAVIDALDIVLGEGKGWQDSDLPQLFKALDAHLSVWEKRQRSA